ncbi:hypothetical protein M432DRAFT_642962 [Thermoascus aurantiacus ATCC 26904]
MVVEEQRAAGPKQAGSGREGPGRGEGEKERRERDSGDVEEAEEAEVEDGRRTDVAPVRFQKGHEDGRQEDAMDAEEAISPQVWSLPIVRSGTLRHGSSHILPVVLVLVLVVVVVQVLWLSQRLDVVSRSSPEVRLIRRPERPSGEKNRDKNTL